MTAIETKLRGFVAPETGARAMNATKFWEFKKTEEHIGRGREPEAAGLPMSLSAFKKRVKNAEPYPWKGPGTLWVAKPDDDGLR